MTDRLTLQDPREQYPKPPFPRQPQPVPGEAREMDPKPDHGEDSYQGSGKLKGRKALITGADSGIGRAVAVPPALVTCLTRPARVCRASWISKPCAP